MMFINIDGSRVATRSSPSYAKASEGTLRSASARSRVAERVSVAKVTKTSILRPFNEVVGFLPPFLPPFSGRGPW
jgi:hypothetical protein